MEYEELRFRVRPVGVHRHVLTVSGVGGAAEVLAVDDGRPEAYRRRWERLVEAELGYAPLGDQDAASRLRDLGRDVFGLLLGPRAAEYLGEAQEYVRQLQPARGLRLRFDLPPALRSLPLEALCAPATEPGQSTALHDNLSLVRSLRGGPIGHRLPEPQDAPSKIRLLVVHASPDGETLPVGEDEIALLLRELPQVAVETTLVRPATRDRLETALGERSDLPTAVLLIAHGSYDTELGKGMVHLETAGGGTDLVPADLLSGMLLRAAGLRLAVLNLCSGADSSHTEPFSGLAQALIGGGVPAVVAMHGRVSDRSAGLFGPALLKKIAANQTIDEAMAHARRTISYQRGHTATEWATPALFLHEECRHGWLFKAREVRDGERAAHDPLRQGAAALGAFNNPIGDVNSAQLIEAARFQRLRRKWEDVHSILATDTQRYRKEQQLLREEAAYELAWPKVQGLCELLADEEAPAAQHALSAVRSALPDGDRAWLPLLDKEVLDLSRLTGLLERAHTAGREADWATAHELCEELLAERPAGFGDTVRLREAAAEELALADACERAAAACAMGDWAGASTAYGHALDLRRDHRPALAGTAYAHGRSAEDAGDWPAAADAFGRCPQLYDATARGAYARARAAAAAGDWRTAHEAFAQASALYSAADVTAPDVQQEDVPQEAAARNGHPAVPDSGDVTLAPLTGTAASNGHAHPPCAHSPGLPSWLAYAAARVAEGEERWEEAAERFAVAVGFDDAVVRAHHARGRAAVKDGAWCEALAAMRAAVAEPAPEADGGGPARAHEPEPGNVAVIGGTQVADAPVELAHGLPAPASWIPELQERVRESAVAAAESGQWERALDCLRLLPDAYEDTWAQRRFAEGRVAEAAGEWSAAAEAYSEAGQPDAQARLRYALGRAAALCEEWDAAREHFAEVPDHIHDFAEPPEALRLYAQGRAAGARCDWKAAVLDFGGLPDSHADGDVGHRRKYARARVAEQQEDARPDTWTSVLGHLDGVPDEALDGAVGLLRRKATGQHALSLAELERARGLFEPYAADDAEFALLHGYVLARLHERDQAWEEALAAYEELPGHHADVAPRTRYARARVAEAVAGTAEQWGAVRELYAELADAFADDGGYADAAVRARYARARHAEAEGDWEEACRTADALRGHADAPLVAAYARGRLTEAQRDWHRAVDAFRASGPYRDAEARLAHCEGRLLEEQGRFAAAAEAYERAGGDHEGARAQAVRLRGVLRLAWVDGAIGEPLVADPFALRDETFPYLALRDAGVGPGSSMDVVNNLSFTLMERDGTTWTWPERVAWDRLRVPARRLELDALLYRWHAPAAVREAVAHLAPDDGSDPLDALCERFPKDAPLLLLLARGRDAAVAAWEERLAKTPGDMTVVHGLAVARLWQARELEHSGAWEHAVRAWEEALAYWAAVLSDEGYWDGWRAERAGCYQRSVPLDDLARLRRDLSLRLSEHLAAGEETHTDQDRPEQAGAYRQLTALFEAELGGARVLKEVGGLPTVPGTAVALACGPRYLRMLRLEVPLAERVAELSAAAQQGQDPGEFAVRKLRWAFSVLSPAYALAEAHRFEEALVALPALAALTELPEDCAGPGAEPAAHVQGCGHCRDFVRRDPAYLRLTRRQARFVQDGAALAVQVRLSLAQTALTSGLGGLDRALAQWSQAVLVSKSAGMQARTNRAVVQMVLGRMEALIDTPYEQRDAALDEAVVLAEQVKPVLQPLAHDLAGQLDAQLSLVLSMRGVWRASSRGRHGLPLDVPAAEADLRRALELNPESGHARGNLVRALVYTLEERTADPVEQLGVLHEAIGLLHTGLRQELAHNYRETLAETLNALERLVSERIGIDGLAELMRAMAQEQPADENDLAGLARNLADRARRALEEDGDVALAVHLLIRAARTDPSSAQVRSFLLDAVGRWRETLRGRG
ncbi:CHAT domain-containing protein, partial [Streptomyces sp. NPDC001663]|uniref:CHAT domain-containing protein n=1 Tax=Streptomyces sp. NPDC001663 TaxID=3364597 RepID=UPI003675A44C